MAGDGGEIRAIFKGAQEDMTKVAEDTGNKVAEFIDQTAQNAEDSIRAVEDADGASADAARGVRSGEASPQGGSGGSNPIDRLLNGEPRLRPGTPEYERYANELAQDPAHGGQVSAKSLREAAVGIGAEADGDLPGPLTRAPFTADGRDQGEFTDATGQNWDVKSSPDVQPDYGRSPGRPIPNPKTDADFTDMVNHELEQGTNVLLDPHAMTPARLTHLKELVASHPEWGGKVIWGR